MKTNIIIDVPITNIKNKLNNSNKNMEKEISGYSTVIKDNVISPKYVRDELEQTYS